MTQDLVPRDVPIVGEPDEIAMVLRTAEQRGRPLTPRGAIKPIHLESGKYVVTVRMLAPPEPAPRPGFRARLAARHRSLGQGGIGTAMMFVGILFVLGLTLLGATYLMMRGALAGVDWPKTLGAGAVAVILLYALASRANHSGACPGVAVHCRGCRH